MADDAHDILARQLADILARLGNDVLEDRRKLTALLADAMPGHGRQVRLLGIAIDNGAARAISRARLDQVELEVDRYAQRIDSDLGVRKAIALPVLRAIAFASGRGALPSMFTAIDATSQVRGEVELTPQEESWIGVSAGSAAAPPPQPAPPPPPPATPPPAPAPVSTPPAQPSPPPQPAATAAPSPPPASAVQPPSQPVAKTAPAGLGGWLIAWVAWLVVVTLVSGYHMVDLYSLHLQSAYSGIPPILLVSFPLQVGLGILVLVLHVVRLRIVRFLWFAWLLGAPLLTVLWYGATHPLPWVVAAVSVVGCLYFLGSRQVRNTYLR